MNISISAYAIILSFFGMYFFPSGGLQPVTFIIFLYFFASLNYSSFPRHYLWLTFLIYIFLHSIIWALIYQEIEFAVHAAQALFGLITLLVSYNIHQNLIRKKEIGYVIIIIIFLNFCIYLFDMGRYDFYPRYNGLLNDPNQYGYYLLSLLCYSIIFIKNKLLRILAIMVLLFLIGNTFSRSTLLGLISITFVSFPTFTMLLAAATIPIVASLTTDNYFVNRIFEIDFAFEFWQRGFYRLMEFPEMLFIGAGKGLDSRFGYGNLEIHSTPVAVIFYFGIIGFLLYVGGLLNHVLKKDYRIILLVTMIVFYGLTTYNIRTPITWWSIGLIATFLVERNREKSANF